MIVQDKRLNKILCDQYHSIIPTQEDGLIVFNIFNKIQKGILDAAFSERAIINAIQTVQLELGTASNRELTQKNDETIHRLLKHFMERSNEGRGYQLTTYGEVFCRMLQDEAIAHINPTDLERIFSDLVLLLKSKLDNLSDFNHWYEFQFTKNKGEISGQVRALKFQIDETIETLNDIVKSDPDNFKMMLQECDNLLSYIREQAVRLGTAFASKDDIKQMLDECNLSDEPEFRNRKKLVRDFFKDVEGKLIGISHSIDRIRPRINKLYSDFDKREFDRKLETFLMFLFKNSTSKFIKTKRLTNRTVNEIKVTFPKPLPSMKKAKVKFDKSVYYNYSKFTQVEYLNLLDPPPMEIYDMTFDAADLERQKNNKLLQLSRERRIEHWFGEINTQLKEGKEVEFGDYFYKILDQEKDLEIAIKEATLMLREYAFNPKYTLNIDEKFIVHKKHPHTAIWKMQIQQNIVS
ncbi:MAG: hypothetical protein H7331_09215 [Bacteroidia bacterium]|nr:hypothetical protein [Bacteroidia bacterium]